MLTLPSRDQDQVGGCKVRIYPGLPRICPTLCPTLFMSRWMGEKSNKPIHIIMQAPETMGVANCRSLRGSRCCGWKLPFIHLQIPVMDSNNFIFPERENFRSSKSDGPDICISYGHQCPNSCLLFHLLFDTQKHLPKMHLQGKHNIDPKSVRGEGDFERIFTSLSSSTKSATCARFLHF